MTFAEDIKGVTLQRDERYHGRTTTVDMNFILIPFLLATDLISNDDAWNNGPEYSFSISASTISNMGEGEGRLLGTTLLTTLKCRPREPDDLNCYFEDATIGRMTPKKFHFGKTLPPWDMSYKMCGFSKANFEIRFDRNGIEDYIFEKEEKVTSQFLVDMFRTFANQLSIGTSLDGKDESFRGRENFTMGKCPSDYRIYRTDVDSDCDKKKFNLVSLMDWELNNEEILHIERQRVLNECLPRDLCYFGTRYTYNVVPENYTDKLVSSTTDTMMSTNCFISETLNTVDILDTDNKKVGSAIDRIRVSLESIDPGQGSLRPIYDPISVDVVVRSSSNYGTQ